MNNALLRGDYDECEYTDEMKEELIKCIKDPIYFITHYIKIISAQKKILFDLREYQIKYLRLMHENSNVMCMWGRQSGKSVSTAAYIAWKVIFNPNVKVLLLADQQDKAVEQLKRIKEMIQDVPIWMQMAVRKWAAKGIILSNNSEIRAAATHAKAASGYTVNFLYLDEFALVDDTIAQDFMTSVFPTVSSDPDAKIAITSCVTKDTMVYTDKGIKEIGDFVIENRPDGFGYEVPEYKVQGKRDEPNTGVLIHNDGLKETRIIKSMYSSLESSLEHKYHACKNGVYGTYRAKELEVGDFIAIRHGMNLWGNNDELVHEGRTTKSSNTFNLDRISKDFAYFIGLYLAEGYSRRIVRNGHKCGASTIISCGDDITSCLDGLNLRYRKIDNVHYVISSTSLVDALESIGFDICLKAKNKVIPKRLLEMSKENIVAMLQGLYDGDGSAHANRGVVKISLASKRMIEQIRVILINLGILSTYHEGITPPTKRVNVSSNYYSIEITGKKAIKFFSEVGFRFERKQKNSEVIKLKRKSHADHVDIIPFSSDILRQINKDGNSNHKMTLTPRHKRHISKAVVKKLVNDYRFEGDAFNDFVENVDDNITWTRITNICSGHSRVYDFSLNPNPEDKWHDSVVYAGILGRQTPRGKNNFYRMWEKNEKKAKMGQLGPDDFITFKIRWNDVPGRDDAWRLGELEKLGEVAFKQEYDCAFEGSLSTLVHADYISAMKKSFMREPANILDDKKMRIFSWPISKKEIESNNYEYLITVDPAMGTGQDYTVAQVWLIKSNTDIEQVAIYRSNDVPPDSFVTKILALCKMYHTPYVIIETMEPAGGIIISRLMHDNDYYNVINMQKEGIGFRMSHEVKIKSCTLLQVYCEKQVLKIRDEITYSEIEMFGKRNNTFKALGDTHDDCVMSALSMLYYVNSNYFYGNMDDVSIHRKPSSIKADELDAIDDPLIKDALSRMREVDEINGGGGYSGSALIISGNSKASFDDASRWREERVPDQKNNPMFNPNANGNMFWYNRNGY